MKVAECIEALIEREGPFSDRKSDRGGPTCWGITEKVARRAGYIGAMQDLPKDFARQVYLDTFWLAPKLDKVAQLSTLVAEEMLDTGVNLGPGTAVKFLQRALNALNQRGKLFFDQPVDGAIGPATLNALSAYLRVRGHEGEVVLERVLNAFQSVYYVELAERDESQEDSEFGWQKNRVVM